MEHMLKIPIPYEIHEEFADCLVESEKEPEDVIWKIIKSMCKDARIGKLNKSCSYIMLDAKGTQTTRTERLKNITLEKIGSDPQWLPPGMEKKNAKYFQYKLNEKLWEYFQTYCSFDAFRRKKIIESMEKNTQDEIDSKKHMLANATAQERQAIEKEISQMESDMMALREDARKNAITCVEQVAYSKIYPEIFRMATENIEQSLEKENEELYPKKKG